MTELEAAKRIKEFGLHHAIQDLPHSAFTVEAFKMAIDALIEKSKHKESCLSDILPPPNA